MMLTMRLYIVGNCNLFLWCRNHPASAIVPCLVSPTDVGLSQGDHGAWPTLVGVVNYRLNAPLKGNDPKSSKTTSQPSARVTPDLMHSQQETRYIAVGRNQSGRAMFVAFAIKQALGDLHLIRPTSARFMHGKEVQRYEENSDVQN